MAAFDDRWMARADSDDASGGLASHPLFGDGSGGGSVLFHSHHDMGAFNPQQQQPMMQQPSRRRIDDVVGDSDDDEALLIGRNPSNGVQSTSAQPASQQYTEAASSEAFSQESASSQNPAKLRTEEFIGFWSHRVPRQSPATAPQHPPTPQMQRTFAAATEESPSALVDGIVRAGLETPSRFNQGDQHQHGGPYARPAPPSGWSHFAAHPDTPSSASAHSAHLGSMHVADAARESPNSTFSSGGHSGGGAETTTGRRYRTVQQHFEMQQGPSNGNSNNASSPSAAGGGSSRLGSGAMVSGRPLAPPRGAEPTPTNGLICILEFKMDRRRRFWCPQELAHLVAPDQWVVVQLDNNGGIDMGSCVEVYAARDRLSIPKSYGHGECGTVLRLADEEDCKIINEVIPGKEEVALAKAHQLVHFLHMPFTCIDAEFQFDLKAVNLYYTLTPQAFTSVIPNVSRLQRELGFLLKAKVHLEQLVPVEE